MSEFRPIPVALYSGPAGARQPHDAVAHADGQLWPRTAHAAAPLLHLSAAVRGVRDHAACVNDFPTARHVVHVMHDNDEAALAELMEAFARPEDVDELLRELAAAQATIGQLSEAQRARLEAVKQSPAYQADATDLEQVKERAAALDQVLRARAVVHYRVTGSKQINSVLKVREQTRVVYDEGTAIEWCRINLPTAFKFDATVFEAYVRAVAKVNPVKFAALVADPTGTISARLLTEYLPPPPAA